MEMYFDNSATTCVLPEVAQIVNEMMLENYGNPSSMHGKGLDAENALKEASKKIASILHVSEKEILYTSGGTESDNMALIGVARANCRAGKHIITTKIEHAAILETCKYLESEGYEITYLGVDSNGIVDLEELRNAIRPDTILVSIMGVNNEIGSTQPMEQIGKLIKETNPNILYHVDAVQAFGKMKILPKTWKIDLLSVSSHKIHGPKGVGFLYINGTIKIRPIIFGGGQQRALRSGTENVPGICGMAKACEIAYTDLEGKVNHMNDLRLRLIEGLKDIEGITINGLGGVPAPHIVSVSIDGIRAEVVLHALEAKDVYVSSGSACASNKPAISETLKAIGVDKSLLDSTVRFSFCELNTLEEVDEAVEILKRELTTLRKYVRR